MTAEKLQEFVKKISAYVHQDTQAPTAKRRLAGWNVTRALAMVSMDNVTVSLDMVALTAVSSLLDAPMSVIGVESVLKLHWNQNTAHVKRAIQALPAR